MPRRCHEGSEVGLVTIKTNKKDKILKTNGNNSYHATIYLSMGITYLVHK